MHSHCAALNCPNGKHNNQPLFRFPKDPDRCKKWVENCKMDHEDIAADQLYRYYRLCVKHFDASSFDNNSQDAVKVLKDDAVPTVFDISNKPPNGQTKRGSEKTEDDELMNKEKKKIKNTQAEKTKDDPAEKEEEKEAGHKEHLKSLFDVLVLLGEQNIPLKGPEDNDKPDAHAASCNFQSLFENWLKVGEEASKNTSGADPVNKEPCSATHLSQLLEVCEKCIRHELLEEVRKNTFFSLVTDDVVKISDELYLPVFLRYLDQVNCQQEKFLGFLSFEGDDQALAERLLSELTDKWGVNMEHCRGQAHFYSATYFSKIKAFATQLTEKYPLAVLTPVSTCALNISLAHGMDFSGVHLIMSTFKKIDSFFLISPLLRSEFEHAISIFYADKEEKASRLKEVCQTSWTLSHDAFEIAVDILESLLLCVDSVHDNEEMRWSDQVTQEALEISKALADFEFVMSLVVLKNVLTLVRAFGKNVQGEAKQAHFAANSLKAVLHSLAEVHANIDVYHEFWHDEATNIATALEIPVKVPRSLLRRQRSESGVVTLPESYYKDHLSVPVVNHVIREVQALFCENHLKALKCLHLVPGVLGQHKAAEPEEQHIHMYKDDIPNASTLTAELHCWSVKWSHRSKGEPLPDTLQETLQLPDVKFFPNVLAVLRVVGTLPTFVVEGNGDVAYRRFKAYVESTVSNRRSRTLALLSVNADVRHDLDSMVDAYLKTYPECETVE